MADAGAGTGPETWPDGNGTGNGNGNGKGGRRVELSEVPETLLWNLYMRAAEARRARTVLADPKAVELVDRIDYPFEETFGAPSPLLAQGHALRVRTFDAAVRAFLDEHPDGTVVTLAEGLETQYWRVDNGRARWLCVELPETAEVRRALLPDEEQPAHPRPLGARPVLAGRGRSGARGADHRAGAADVSAADRGEGPDRGVRRAVPGRGAGLRRRTALVQRPDAARRDAHRAGLSGAAHAVGHGRG